MSEINNFLPPKELWPERIYTLPEYKEYPQKMNSTEELLDKNLEKGRGKKVAILFEDKKFTYEDVYYQCNQFANGLKELGIGIEDRIIIRSPNIPEAVIANFAIIKLGAISVPTSPLFAAKELAHVSNNCGAKAIITFFGLLPDVEKAKPDLESVKHIIVIGGDPNTIKEKGFIPLQQLMQGANKEFSPVRRDRHDISILLYTSGTTGPPKGTAHMMEESLIVADGFGKYCWRITENDVIGGSAPLAFGAGHATFCAIPYRFGATASLIARFTPEGMFETIQNHRITVLTLLPTAYRKMLEVPDAEKKYDLSSLRILTGGGESLTAKTYYDWKNKFGQEIFESLGTTEMFFVFISNAVSLKAKPGSIGQAVPGYEVKVVNEEGKEVGIGESGMLIARGPTGTLYWAAPEKQKGSVMNGWNKAGDFVYRDEDNYFWFLSREDDLIKSSGYRIGPEEIELALVRHPAIADAGVIGVPDPVRGQNVKAFIVLKPGNTPSDELKEEILSFLKENIAIYKLPREIEFIDELPRTVTGKLLRRVLRQKDMEKKK